MLSHLRWQLNMKPTQRKNLRRGQRVKVVLKKDQGTGALTEGIIDRILTNSPHHPRGIKVKLEDGQVGRVQKILEAPEEEEEDVWALIRRVSTHEVEEEDPF